MYGTSAHSPMRLHAQKRSRSPLGGRGRERGRSPTTRARTRIKDYRADKGPLYPHLEQTVANPIHFQRDRFKSYYAGMALEEQREALGRSNRAHHINTDTDRRRTLGHTGASTLAILRPVLM